MAPGFNREPLYLPSPSHVPQGHMSPARWTPPATLSRSLSHPQTEYHCTDITMIKSIHRSHSQRPTRQSGEVETVHLCPYPHLYPSHLPPTSLPPPPPPPPPPKKKRRREEERRREKERTERKQMITCPRKKTKKCSLFCFRKWPFILRKELIDSGGTAEVEEQVVCLFVVVVIIVEN